MFEDFARKNPTIPTHVSYQPYLKWAVEHDQYDEFVRQYCSGDLGNAVGEVVGQYLPFILDIVLSFDSDNVSIGDKFRRKLISIIHEQITDNIDDNGIGLSLYHINYLQSDCYKSNNHYKINIRLWGPYCRLTREQHQQVFHEQLATIFRSNNLISCLSEEPKNGWESAIQPLARTDYPLYGSTKYPNDKPVCYQQTYDHNLNRIELEESFEPIRHQYVSVDNYIDQSDITIMVEDYGLEAMLPLYFSLKYFNKRAVVVNQQPQQRSIDIPDTNTNNPLNNTELLEFMINILDNKRWKERWSVRLIGNVIFNIYNGSDAGMKLWLKSAQENKCSCIDLVTEQNYHLFASYNNSYEINYDGQVLTLKSIAALARIDNGALYDQWHKSWVFKGIRKVVSKIEDTVSQVVYRINWLEIACERTNKLRWYVFEGRRWKQYAPEQIVSKFSESHKWFMNYIEEELIDDGDPANAEINKVKRDNINKAISGLQSVAYRKRIIESASQYFYIDGFERLLDHDGLKHGVKNGLLCFHDETPVFRRAIPEDYISVQINNRYNPRYTFDHPQVKRVTRLFEQYFWEREVIEFMYQYIASTFDRYNRDKKFINMVGQRNTGKSTFQDLIRSTLGSTRAVTGDNKTLEATGKFGGGPSPEVDQLRHAMIIFYNELSNRSKGSEQTLKTFTGGDNIFARRCNENGGAFKIRGKIITISNKAQDFDGVDEALRERFVLLRMGTRFTDDAPEDINEQWRTRKFRPDNGFEKELLKYTEALLWVLVQKYKDYASNGQLIVPDPLINSSRNHIFSSDAHHIFINRYTEVVHDTTDGPAERVTDNEIEYEHVYRMYEEFVRTRPGTRMDNPSEFIHYMSDAGLGHNYDSERRVWITDRRIIDDLDISDE